MRRPISSQASSSEERQKLDAVMGAVRISFVKIESLKNEISSFESARKLKEDALSSLQKEIEQTKKDLEDLQSLKEKSLKEHMDTLERIFKEKKLPDNLKKEIESLDSYLRELKNDISSHKKEKETVVENHLKEKSILEDLINSLDRNKKAIESEIDEKLNRIRSLTQTINDCSSRVFGYGIKINEHAQVLEGKKNDLENLNENIKKVQEETKSLLDIKDFLLKEIDGLEGKKGLLIAEVDAKSKGMISLAKREIAVKSEEGRLKKMAEKFGIPMNF